MKHIVSLTTLVLVMLCAPAFANNNLKVVGQAEMRWLMFPLYKVSLMTQDGQYQQGRYPQALDITYRRNIAKEDLLTATDQQWQRLGVNVQKRQQWLTQLGAIWPSVKRGDRLAFIVEASGNNYFLYNDKNIGGVKDAQFGQSFLSIWLSPNTSQPGIRRLLIREN